MRILKRLRCGATKARLWITPVVVALVLAITAIISVGKIMRTSEHLQKLCEDPGLLESMLLAGDGTAECEAVSEFLRLPDGRVALVGLFAELFVESGMAENAVQLLGAEMGMIQLQGVARLGHGRAKHAGEVETWSFWYEVHTRGRRVSGSFVASRQRLVTRLSRVLDVAAGFDCRTKLFPDARCIVLPENQCVVLMYPRSAGSITLEHCLGFRHEYALFFARAERVDIWAPVTKAGE